MAVMALFGLVSAAQHAAAQTAPPAVYWLDTGPERGPYNDQTLRHGHRSPTDVVAGSVFLSLPNYMVAQGLAVDAVEGKVYTGHRSLFTGQITIRKMNLDGSGLETLHVFPGGAYGQMEFNPADGKLYIFGGATFARMNASTAAIAADGGVNVQEIAFPTPFSVTRGDIDLVSGKLVVMNTNAPGDWPFYSINFDGTGAQALGAVCPPHTCYPGRLQRDVAIKVVPAAIAAEPAALARFEREAQAVAALSTRTFWRFMMSVATAIRRPVTNRSNEAPVQVVLNWRRLMDAAK